MKQNRKKAGALLCALALVLALGTGCSARSTQEGEAQGIPAAPTDSYVLDEAGILSQETEEYVNQKTQALRNACGSEIVVVAVEYTGSLSTEEYALTVGENWGVGDKDKDNGIVLLLVPGADDYWCLQGKGLETTLPTSTLSRILQQQMEPQWVQKDYDTGTRQTVEALYEELCTIYQVSPEETAAGGSYSTGFNSNAEGYVYQYGRPSGGAVSTAVSLAPFLFFVIIAVVVVLLLFPRGPRGGGGGGSVLPWLLLFGGGPRWRGPRPPHGPGGFGGFGGGFGHGGGFGGGFGHGGGGGFGGFGGGGFHGGGAGRGR